MKLNGFTLIELLISIFVLSMGIIGVLGLFPISAHIAKSSQMLTIANQLGQAKLEEIVSKPYEEISASTENYGEIPGFESFKRVTEVAYYDPQNSTTTESDLGIKRVSVSVFWKSPVGVSEKNISFITLVAKR